MQLHPEIGCGWLKGNKEDINRVWRNLEAELNAAGPPSKCIAEWKKVWCDRKKYVRHKAAQNLKAARGTGGGPNTEQKLSESEEAIYALIGMKESVEGVARPFGLGTSSGKKPERALPPLPESDPPTLPATDPPTLPESAPPLSIEFDDGARVQYSHYSDKDTPQKPPAKKFRASAQSGLNEALAEQICTQKKILDAMVEQNQVCKKIYRSIDRPCDVKKEELKEQKRHNIVMEKIRLREVDDKIERNRRLLEIEELKMENS